MPKLLSLILAFSCFLGLSGCGNDPDTAFGGQVYFNAAILELNDGSIEIECTEEFKSGISAGEKFSISTDVSAVSGTPEFAVGDNIRVVFDGIVMESYPLQIGTVFAIYLLDENGEVIPND